MEPPGPEGVGGNEQGADGRDQALLDALAVLPRTRPAGPAEAEVLLARLRSAAARWADVLYEANEGSGSSCRPARRRP